MCKEICSLLLSRPSRGAWIEICISDERIRRTCQSRPSRGAWIEMEIGARCRFYHFSRAPRGARGLKYTLHDVHSHRVRRAPRGARGLKFL